MMEILEANGFAVANLCRVLGASRNGYYTHKKTYMAKVKNDDVILNEIGSIIIDFPRYGYRRIAKELKIRKFKVNRKRVLYDGPIN